MQCFGYRKILYVVLLQLLLHLFVTFDLFAEEKISNQNPPVQQDKNYTETDSSDETALEAIHYKDYFFMDIRVLSYGIVQEPSASTQNPRNDLLQIPRYILNLETRPDFRFDSQFLEISAKPRAKFDYSFWKDGRRDGETQWNDDWYMNEWLVRLKIADTMFVSYGRENLQWGPSFLYSPSNPFFSDNGRSNPYLEVNGMDFARIVIVPHSLFSVSFIINTDEGRNPFLGPDPFKETYALKVDYTGRQNYVSLILSKRDGDDYNPVLGFFGGWTVSDAVLLYIEGNLTEGSNALYPKRNSSILGISMRKIYWDDSAVNPVVLLGGSYTLEKAGTFYLEYLYNGQGYENDEANLYYDLRKKAAAVFERGGIARIWGAYLLGQTVDTGLRFLRKIM